MATYQQKTTSTDPHSGMPHGTDPVDPAAPNVRVNQRNAASDSGMTGIIIAVVVLLIGAILAFNYGWFGGSDTTVTNNNTTETAPATGTDTSTSTSTTAEPETSTTTTTTEPTGTATGTDTGTTGTGTTGTDTGTTGTGTTTTTEPQ